MKKKHPILFNVNVVLCMVPYTLAVINVTLTGTTTKHVCKGEDIDFKWTYDDTDPDKDFIKTVQWSKDPSGYLIMQYQTDTTDLSITSNPNDYTGRVERTTEAGSNDIGMRLKQAGSTDDVDDDGKYYVSLIVDKDPGDANDYFVPYMDQQGVQVYVCVGVDDTFSMPSLNLTYDENTHVITCSGPSSLGDTTFSIFDPSMNTVVNSTTDTVISKDISSNRIGGTYICKAYFTQQGYNETPQGVCLPTDTTIVLPAWSSWNTWSNCTTPAATSIRTRTCDNPPPTVYGPQSCPGVNSETEICPTPPPTINGSWGDWTAWTPCSVTCDNGTETRTRECDDPAPKNGGDNCTGDYDEIMECFERYCPVNGGWGNWKIWTACSVTCENGTQTRTRECDNPEPENGGDNCTGDYDEIMECFERYCPVNGSWGDWTAWTPCSVTCENGTQTRTRECDDPAPVYGGENCTGDYDEVMECFDRDCPVNGAWGNWKIWTSCSVTCDNGTQTRTRECDDPAPEYGGENCTGDYEEIMECFERYCPVNGAWGNWKIWIPCSVTCDNGTQTRNRECDDPAPEYGGDDCTGPYVEIIECFEEQCSTNRSSGDWTVWTQCSVTCGNGTQIRNRECETTEPSNGGNNCTRPVAEIMECFEGYCPVNGSWGNWTVWTPCSVTCGNGTQTRNRECDSPAPEYGGDNCSGSYDEISECFGEYCIAATTVHQPEADSVWPTFGPQSGGTDITIRGQSLLIHGQVIVYVGPKECTTVYLNETVTIVRTLGLQADEANLLDRKLAVYIAIDNSTNLTSIAEFTYRTDPVVDSVYPKESIVPGGTSINARGSNFYSVAVIKMETTMLLKKWIVQKPTDQNETRTLHITDCEVQSDTQMKCLTASITLPDVFIQEIVKTKQKRDVNKPTLAAPDIGPLHSRSKRQGNPQWVTPDGDYTLEFYIGFRLDGVHDYNNFTPIAIYVEPVFVESGSRKKFEKGERISFKGEQLDKGVTVHDYAITVGLEICTDVELLSNSLSCLPPQTKPNTTANEEEIIVYIGLNLDHFAGHLIYPNGQLPFYVWVLVGVLPALLIIVIIVIIVLRQNTVQ